MLQLVLLLVSIALICLGIKGLTGNLQLSPEVELTDTSARIVGALCVVLGIGLMPIFYGIMGLFIK